MVRPTGSREEANKTPFGLFEYLFMPFGLTNAAQSFQRLMDKLFRHFPFVFTYLDDHLIASRTLEEHLLHLQQFFQVLQENGLTINPAKCVFAVSSLKFLGHMVDEAGITPLPRHVAAVQDCPPPTDIKQLQRFLGLINFYWRFLPGGGPHSSAAHGFVERFAKGTALVSRRRCRIRRRQGRPGSRSSALPSRSKRNSLTLR